MSEPRTAVEDEFGSPAQCWCCGYVDDPTLLVHLGNHPEVALCRRCARWAAKQAWEIDDRTKMDRWSPSVTGSATCAGESWTEAGTEAESSAALSAGSVTACHNPRPGAGTHEQPDWCAPSSIASTDLMAGGGATESLGGDPAITATEPGKVRGLSFAGGYPANVLVLDDAEACRRVCTRSAATPILPRPACAAERQCRCRGAARAAPHGLRRRAGLRVGPDVCSVGLRLSPVDRDDGAVDERRVVRQQEGDEAGDLLRLPNRFIGLTLTNAAPASSQPSSPAIWISEP